MRYVLVYLLERPDGVTMIDAGWDTEEAWSALNAGLGKAGYEIGDVKSVLVTHIHPDHYGLAGRVREASGASIALHPADAAILPQRYVQMDGLLDHDAVPPARERRPPRRDRQHAGRVDAGPRVRERGAPRRAAWRTATAPTSPAGTSRADLDPGPLARAPLLLRRRPPGAALGRPRPAQDHPEHLLPPPADRQPAGRLPRRARTSWHRLQVDEVLPAHEYRFRDLAARIVQLRTHHEHRLGEILAVLKRQPGATSWDIATELTWSRPWSEIQFWTQRAALGETLAHLIVLEARANGAPERADSPSVEPGLGRRPAAGPVELDVGEGEPVVALRADGLDGGDLDPLIGRARSPGTPACRAPGRRCSPRRPRPRCGPGCRRR